MYYYAEIDSNCEVIDVHQLSAESSNANYIAITADQYTTASVLGKFYNKLTGAFEILDIENVGYVGDTNVVQMVGTNGKLLSTHLDNMKVEMNAKAIASNLATVATSGSYNDLSDKPTIPTVPSSLPANGGNADTVDNKHASDFATADHTHNYANASHTHAQSEITGLTTALNDKASASHTHSNVTTSASGFMSASDKSKLDGIATGATAISVDSALSSTSTNPVQNKVINTALAGKSDTSHNHDDDYLAKALQMTADNGCVEYEMADQDVLAVFESMPMGLHTGYCPVNSTNAPLSNESWRFLMHKTGTNNYGWIMAFGSYGSVYTNYVNGGTWRGWKNLVDGTSAPLWKHESNGGYYMTASQTVTPSKPLDQCNNGWLLLWSDYDPSTSTTNNADFCTTQIPKRNGVGGLWSGQGFLCTVPTYITETTDDDYIHIKKVYVHNTKLVGYVGNNVSDRRDVVLRAVYEY